MTDVWNYKGWSISYDQPPIPSRAYDWCATSPEYDVDCDEGGFFQCGGDIVHAVTYEDLLQEIEDALSVSED